MSLRKRYESKVLRIYYEVGAFLGIEARSIRRDLADIPDNAKLIEAFEDEHGGMVMKFLIEKEEAAVTARIDSAILEAK